MRTNGSGRGSLANKDKQPFVLHEDLPCGNGPLSLTMPRRPKRHSANHLTTSVPPFDRSKGKIKSWNTVDDIPLDEEDECTSVLRVLRVHILTGACLHVAPPRERTVHASRDQILLDGDEMQYDEDDFGAEDEVFALKGVDSSSGEGSGGEDLGGDDDAMDVDEGASTSRSTKAPAVKPTKVRKPSAPASDSDEDESEDETWGTKKSAYYSANDAHFDSDDEEANQLEEKEARRQQMKAREGMGDEDFGLDNLQALVGDGGIEPDAIGYVSFCSLPRGIDSNIPIAASWKILWPRPRFLRINDPFYDTLRKTAPKPWHWLVIGMISR